MVHRGFNPEEPAKNENAHPMKVSIPPPRCRGAMYMGESDSTVSQPPKPGCDCDIRVRSRFSQAKKLRLQLSGQQHEYKGLIENCESALFVKKL
jgi:hypothetical protein